MRKKQWIVLTLAILLSVGSLTVTAAMADEMSVEGTVIKTETGSLGLLADTTAERYALDSSESLSDMVGEHVKVTGMVEETPTGKAIKVYSVEKAERRSAGNEGGDEY